jgi:hypothetical protein
MTEREALKLALEALGEIEWSNNSQWQSDRAKVAITAIKEALMSVPDGAQPEHGWTPERIAGMTRLKEAQDKKMAQLEQPKVRTGNCLRVGVCASEGHKIAPQRTWVGLTLEELSEIYNQADWDTVDSWEYERAIEAKLKEKNT